MRQAQRHQLGLGGKGICLLLVISFIVASAGSLVSAWEQPAHQAINREAISIFTNGLGQSGKYRNAGFEPDFFCQAPVVTVSGKFALTYDQIWLTMPAADQIISGGFSADEPNVYVSTKHFFDPLALSGVSELTDQSSAHGMVYEAVPATEWALFRADNPYNLTEAMTHYKACLEIPYNASVSAIPATGDFRDLAGKPTSLDEMRSMHLGKAMRGLGEVMHLVADMTQPAHVRNDSHPRYEITEQAITGPVAAAVLHYPRADGLQIADLGNNTWDVMVSLATWTNRNFFSADTITDPVLGIDPENGELPYPSPIFSQFTQGDMNGYPTWFAKFGGKSVPMVKKTAGWFSDTYEITTEFAIRQAEVLLPLAAAANARIIDLFLPTMVLSQQLAEVDADAAILNKAKAAGADDVKQYEATINLVHEISKDPQWQQMGLEIHYSGPGELWRVRNGKNVKITDVEFIDGTVVACQDAVTGEMTEEKPTFYMPLGAGDPTDLAGTAIDYIVEMDDALYVTVNAGARSFRSDPYVFEQTETEIRLTVDRTNIMPGEKVNFTVEIENPPERYELEWDFGDADPDEQEADQVLRTRKTEVSHIYEKEKDYTATVRLIDRKRKMARAEDSVDLSAIIGDLSGVWNIQMTVQEENTFFRSFLIVLMKGMIRYIFAPLAEALELGPIDESAVDAFTFVGTTLDYETTLSRSDQDEMYYTGPLTFIGSNTNYITGSDEIISVSLVMEKGSVVFYAHGFDESGNPIAYPYLKAGSLISNNQMEGTFDLPGYMSGAWTASR